MKNFILLIFSSFTSLFLFAQTGPGGVGSSTNIEAWLDASSLSLINGDSLTNWSDLSGNGNNADLVSGFTKPTFKTSQINGNSAVDFSGDAILEFSSNITTSATTVFSVHNSPNSAVSTSPFSLSNHVILENSTRIFPVYFNPVQTQPRVNKARNSYSIFSLTSEAGLSGVNVSATNGTSTSSAIRNEGAGLISSTVGCRNQGTYANFSNGSVAELIVFNENLNSAKRKIVGNHLAAKYNLTPEQSLYAFGSAHGTQVIGIGQEVDGSHTLAKGDDSLEISNASALGNGDYILVGNDAGGFATSSSVGVGADQRWTQVWRADLTGTPGTIDLTFFLGANNFAADPSNYVILIERVDGDFSNGGTSIQETGRIYDGTAETVTFTGISLNDGDYFTLAEKSGVPPPTLPNLDFGPGGVGSTANIETWLDASSLSLINGDSLTNWSDLSGNGNNADLVSGFTKPTFKTSQINGNSAVDFSGDAILEFSSNITTSATTVFSVHNSPNSAVSTSPFSLSNHVILENSTRIFPVYFNPVQTQPRVNKARNSYSIFSLTSEAGLSGVNVSATNGTSTSSAIRNEGAGLISSTVGCRNQGTYANFSNGSVAELIVFNENLNSAKRKIVSNHLAAKYNLTPEQNLYGFASTHNTEVFGIGQEADGSHLEARGRDSLLINNASALGNGDYLLIGNDNADFTVSTAVPSGINERWNRTWRADLTGTPGTIDLTFFVGANDFAANPNDYVVLIESVDGDFTNGGTSIQESGRVYTGGTYPTVTFTGITLNDGDYITLAEKGGAIESIADTDWSLTTTWNCSCIPGATAVVNILNDVTISSDQEVLDLDISTGSLTFSGSDTLKVHGNLSIGASGSISSGSGTIDAVGTVNPGQTFDNTSGVIAALNNLYVNSTNSVSIGSGVWSISNSLQVSSGGLDVTNATSITLISNSTSTAQVLESMSGAFTGEFIVQRHISGRNSNYSNMASPISDATAADLDDDLVLSNIGGNDGKALNILGGTFSSMWFFDSPTDSYDTILSLTTALPSGRGYEVFLDTVGYFTGRVVDYRGSLSSGTKTFTADVGWNLIGNPYQSFIDWTLVSKGSIANSYYIYNSSTGNFDFFSGTIPDIAPGQGFWAELSSGTQLISFEENDKVDNNSSAFLRRKNNPSFSLALSSSLTEFSHKMEVNFDVNAISELDELDASYLKSPVKDAPAIYSRASNSDKELIVNSLNPFVESQLIPIEIYAGLDGTYSIDAENVTELYKDYSCVYLNDKASNEAIDLSVEQSYQFETTKGTSNRFELIVSNSFIECEKLIEDGSFEQKLDHQLSLRNAYGDWYLDYTLDDSQQQVEIRILNMAGQAVKKPVSFGASNAGTYRLQNLQDLNGIYLIQVKTKDGFLNKTVQL